MTPINLLNKVKNSKTLVHGGLFAIYSFFGKGMSFLLLVILANFIPPAEYGYLSLFTTVSTFMSVLMAFSTEGYFSISFFKKTQDEFRKNFTCIYFLGLTTLFFFVIIIIAGGHRLSDLLDLSQAMLLIAAATSFLTFSFNIQQNYFRIQEKVAKYGVYNISNAILNFGLSLLLVICFSRGWKGRVEAGLVCAIIFACFSVWTFIRNKLFLVEWSKERYKEILAWGIPIIPHHAASWIRQGLDRYIIKFSYTITQVGVFSFALNISNIIETIGVAFNATNSVTLYKTLSDTTLTPQRKLYLLKRQRRNTSLIYILATILVIIIVTPLVYFALPKYIDSIPYFWILAFSALLKCIYYLYCNFLIYYDSTKQLMYITFFTSSLHLLLSLLLTKYSLFITAIIYVFIQGLCTALVYNKARKLIFEKSSE